MTMRLIRWPADIMPVVEMIVESFQYPENEAWSVQTDEKEQLVDGMRNVACIWPLISLIQAVSPPMRDLMRGYVWEEDGRIVGVTIVQRRGSTDLWVVGTVGVLPGHRRRGLARKLLEAALGLMREVTTFSPGHRIEFSVPQWMEAAVAAAEEHRLNRRMEYLLMGMEL